MIGIIMKKQTLDVILTRQEVNQADKVRLVLSLSLPAILAQLTSIAMQYIDAGMVGSLGAGATASIGLVSSSTWLIGGSCIGISAGFYVQVAQLIGARRDREAEDVLRQGLITVLLIGALISMAGLAVSGSVPRWLGGEEEILANSTAYFRIYCMSIPFILIRQLSAGMMQSTGDMKTPSMLSALVCLLDVVLNMLLIFPARTVHIAGLAVTLPGAGLGVVGAALGTALSEVIISLAALYLISTRNKRISLKNKGSWRWRKHTMANAARIAIPLSFDQIFMCSAYVAGTKIVAGLGTVAVAANSLAITAESLCYMPGYGIGAAATAIIGQTIGAGIGLSGYDPDGIYSGAHVPWRAVRLLYAHQQRGSRRARDGGPQTGADRGTALRRVYMLRRRVQRRGRYAQTECDEPCKYVVRAYNACAGAGSPHGTARVLDSDGAGAVFPRTDLPDPSLQRKMDEESNCMNDRQWIS